MENLSTTVMINSLRSVQCGAFEKQTRYWEVAIIFHVPTSVCLYSAVLLKSTVN